MKEQDPRETIMDTWNQLSPAEQDDALITYLGWDGVDAAAPPPDVVGDEGPGDRQIGIGVEAQRELVGVVVEVALDGEASAVEGILASLGRAAESRVELRGAPV